MTNNHLVNVCEKERKHLLDVIRCLRYLARQGIALQKNENDDNFMQLMMLLGTKDESIIAHLDGAIGTKYTHHDRQNELLNIMSCHFLLSKLKKIRENVGFFLIMADQYTDIANKEQFPFCILTVDDGYELENIKSVTVMNATKHCGEQKYNRASNITEKKSGVATKLLLEEPKALATHYQGHPLSLAVKDLTECCKILCDTMISVREICVLVKYTFLSFIRNRFIRN